MVAGFVVFWAVWGLGMYKLLSTRASVTYLAKKGPGKTKTSGREQVYNIGGGR